MQKPMNGPLTPNTVTPATPPSYADAGAPLVHARHGQHCFPGLPPRLNHVLALSDLTPASQPALEFALEVAGCFQARLTLLHGGEDASSQDASGGDDRDRARLLCLFWEAQRRHPDASVCLGLNRRPEQVWAAAAARQADLIVLPQPVFRRFRRLVTREDGRERLQGAPCTVVLVDGALPQDGFGA
jgi:nucleotide-binding universal stress UspA family protein